MGQGWGYKRPITRKRGESHTDIPWPQTSYSWSITLIVVVG